MIKPHELRVGTAYVMAHPAMPGVEDCQSSGETGEVPFTVGPEAALPSLAGALEIQVAMNDQLSVWFPNGTCASTTRSAEGTLVISPDQALVPFLPVTRWKVEVDGQHWSTSRWGGLDSEGGLLGGSIGEPRPTAGGCTTTGTMGIGLLLWLLLPSTMRGRVRLP